MEKINFTIKIYLSGILGAVVMFAGLLICQNKAIAAHSDSTSVVKAIWEMSLEKEDYNYQGTDDSIEAGAQFIPSGKYQESNHMAVCAIIAVFGSEQNITAIGSSVFYPEDIFLGPNYSKEQKGCGQLIEQNQMVRLNKNDGIDLLCSRIKNYNNSLPLFNGFVNNYDKFCAIDGELASETSAIYCSKKDMLYDDPSGVYHAKVTAQYNNGNIYYFENDFKYLPLTAFDMDFDSIEYGAVKEGKKKIVNGDQIWGNGIPSVRNVGNTRLSIEIMQEDMGLNDTDKISNVEHGAKIGENEKSWVIFSEGVKQKLQSSLNLSEINEIDFSIFVYKFPASSINRYNGNFTLSAVFEDHLNCGDFLPKEIYITFNYRETLTIDPYVNRIFVPAITPLPILTPELIEETGMPASTYSVNPGQTDVPQISSTPNFSPEPGSELLLPIPSSDISPLPSLTPEPGPAATPVPAVITDSMPSSDISPIETPTIDLVPSPDLFIGSTPISEISPIATPLVESAPKVSPEFIFNPTPTPDNSSA